MATLADSLVSSASRKLSLRMRPDLTWRRHFYLGKPYIVVKEPVGLKYFRFQEEEFAILEMLNGNISLEEIKEQFEAEFAPEKISLSDLQNFIGMLHRSGLIIADSPGQGKQLARRFRETRKKKILAAMSNVLAVRFRGIDPDRMLNWLHPFAKIFFHPVGVAAWLIVSLSALLLVTIKFDVFTSKLPAFHEFFGASNWIPLLITLGVVKVLHEFGHGLSCKHYGGECHEMGFMLLVLTPCLYCNVSDSWLLPSKWRRMIIGAAGIYVEVGLASIATFVWWFSEPGLINFLALRVMFICSVSTILFNGNPLLRFDGYYILADYLEIPNLRQKATEVLKRFMVTTCLGIEQPEDPFLPQTRRFWFGMYTIAAVAYRWIITFSILLFLNKVLEPYGLKIIGQAIALMAIVGLVVQPSVGVYKFFNVPGRMHQVKLPRLWATLGVIAAVALAIFYVPLPYHVKSSLEVAPRNAAAVYVDVPGKVKEWLASPGQFVEEGQTLAVLESLPLELAVAELKGKRDVYVAQLANLQFQRRLDEHAHRQIPEIEESLAAIQKQLAEKEDELSRLVIKAPMSGQVFPPPRRAPQQDELRLPAWSGSPMDERNRGAHFSESDLLCLIGDPRQMEAVLVIDQADIDLVREASVAIRPTDVKLAARHHGKQWIASLDKPLEEEFFAICDANGDGRLTRDETPLTIRPRIFAADHNRDGIIDAEEWQRALGGNPVEVKLDGFPYDTFTSDIKEIAKGDLKVVQGSLSNQGGGDVATVTDSSGAQRPLNTSYQARAPLEDDEQILRVGMRGRAKIDTGWQPLSRRIWRFMTRTFHFEL